MGVVMMCCIWLLVYSYVMCNPAREVGLLRYVLLFAGSCVSNVPLMHPGIVGVHIFRKIGQPLLLVAEFNGID